MNKSFLDNRVFQGGKKKFAAPVRGEISEIILTAGINPVVFSHCNGTNDGLIRKGIQFPGGTVKTEQTFQVCKVHHPVLVLCNASVFSSGAITVVVVINNVRNANGILGLYNRGTYKSGKMKYPFHSQSI